MTMHDDDHPFGQKPRADDSTELMPQPKDRSPDRLGSELSTPLPMSSAPMPQGHQGLNPLDAAAGPLLALLARLRNTPAHPAPASLRAQLLEYLGQFEARAQAGAVSRNDMLLARYVLCSALDEAVLSTPWGSASDWSMQSLLITVHNEAWGGEKIFQLLDYCLQSPRERLHLLELLYVCLCLGFEGRYRLIHDGRSQLEALRERTSSAIRSARGEHDRELSPHWRGLVLPAGRLPGFALEWIAIACASAFLVLVLIGLRVSLASDAEAVIRKMDVLGNVPAQSFERPVYAAKPAERPRLAQFLAEDIKARRVIVEDAVDRSVVTVRSDQIFASGSATLIGDLQPLMGRIAEAIRSVKGQVRITGHSDNVPIASPKFPSNWELSQARAVQVLNILAANTGQPERFTAEGRSDSEPLASNENSEGRAKNRRVEITLLAERVE
jgi:type VI secretion system protein ImpK